MAVQGGQNRGQGGSLDNGDKIPSRVGRSCLIVIDIRFPQLFKKQVDEARAVGRLLPFLRLLTWFGIGGDFLETITCEIGDIKEQLDALVHLHASFNNAFSERGWLLSESTNVETAKKVLAAHEQGRTDEAETLLASDFDGERLPYIVMHMCHLDEFMARVDQLREASRLTQERRYLAASPLLLIIADGVGTDAFGKSLFAEGVDLEEISSFAGQPDALPNLIREMSGTRRRTNSEELTFPYRNGILHGRDLGYGNQLVNAKCWSLLGNIADVIRARNARLAFEPELATSLSDTLKGYARARELNRRINTWTPRPVIERRICVSPEIVESMDERAPEKAMVEFLEAWESGNYGRMAKMTIELHQLSINQRAGEIRQLMEGIALINTVITRIEDTAPAVTEINVDLRFRSGSEEFTKCFTFRMIFQDQTGGGAVHGEKGGYWRIRPEYQYQYWGK